ncbi:MAG TPA: hypothetical protein PKE63_10105 [Lacibacter sp.]|nr:hypothetical protein [Lacibacter sp.]HMO90140.1 hypothetical protein [Lacibacter sp.]HMP87619.1 hypothetical protein [Lacibacter sp.]
MDPKTTAWLAYLTPVGWIIALLQHGNMQPKSSLVVFHLRQMFGLLVAFACVQIVSYVTAFLPGSFALLWVLYVFLFVLWLSGILSAINGEEKPLPFFGVLFQEWFAFIK